MSLQLKYLNCSPVTFLAFLILRCPLIYLTKRNYTYFFLSRILRAVICFLNNKIKYKTVKIQTNIYYNDATYSTTPSALLRHRHVHAAATNDDARDFVTVGTVVVVVLPSQTGGHL